MSVTLDEHSLPTTLPESMSRFDDLSRHSQTSFIQPENLTDDCWVEIMLIMMGNDLPGLHALAVACRYFDRLMKSLHKVDSFLSKYFTDVLKFRTFQEQTGTLIWGSAVLHFFRRTGSREASLEILAQQGYIYPVGLYLTWEEGYVYYSQPGISGDWNDQAPDHHLWWQDKGALRHAIPENRERYLFRRTRNGIETDILVTACMAPMAHILSQPFSKLQI